MLVEEAIEKRFSTRAFLEKPVSRQVLEDILAVARHSPSGGNIQPWQVVAVSGNAKQRVTQSILDARGRGVTEHPDFPYYPSIWKEPYLARRRSCGLALYQALGIKREDKERRLQVWDDNYHFFHAPLGLLFFMDRDVGQGAWVDMGLFLQTLMLTATARGLGCCPQAAIADYPDEVRQAVNVSDSLMLVCGMSLGYPDEAAPINNYRTEREAIDRFYQWMDA